MCGPVLGDRDRHFPVRRLQGAELGERHRRAAVKRVPVRLGGWAEGRQRRSIVASIEGRVRLHHPQHRADRFAHAGTFGREIVFDAPAHPQPGDFLIQHESKTLAYAHARATSQKG